MLRYIIGDYVDRDLLNLIEKLEFEKHFIEYFKTLRLNHDFSDAFSVCFDLEKYTEDDYLIMALSELKTLMDFYNAKNISSAIMLDTLSDLKYRIERYYAVNDAYGLSAHDMKWLGYIYRYETFQIGSLKYRKYPLTYAEIERTGIDYLPLSDTVKKNFYEGLNVVYVHIANGADLSEEAVTSSFASADIFFDTHFPEYDFDYYISRTWLLYPGLDEILDEESNIIKFKNRFEIIGTHHGIEQSLSRIYGTVDLEEIKKLDKTSSLMNTAYKHLDSLGVGVGVIRRRNKHVS